ncbi:stage II sporulation protein R [Hathewaya limosa]|uniref:Stage II sporulation protein R n=1 Tax=Hathewaya limosa TaxID=1536 RepID=A0ABU0JQ53_HATLI|nr:stage II sporulation protein R [Hathewaya limosa]AWZ49328.1 stage II sporulation protein R [Clostridiaceae bacterium 14S0207]MDQ0478376.1 stage II sporulation protein R [Hathewaya limosa]
MKRLIIFITIGLFLCGIFYNSKQVSAEGDNNTLEDISSKIIRFHVIANSDTEDDQSLKLKVRDKVLEYISPKLKECKNIDESRKIMKENNDTIINICNETIKDLGYKYSVKTTLGRENFPVKTYGNITLPQGNYEAYRIVIGTGEGHNWWCIMFPPLCFADVTKVEVDEKKAENEMKTVLDDKEYNFINNKKSNVKVKFKVLELLNK